MKLVEIVVHLVLVTAALSKREVVSLSLDDAAVSSFVLALILILLLGLAVILILVRLTLSRRASSLFLDHLLD